MAKRVRKTKKTAEEIEAIEMERVAAHEMPVEPIRFELIAQREEYSPAEIESATRLGLDVEREPVEMEEAISDEPQEEEIKEPNSVVAEKFKLKYIANAVESGHSGKAAKRSNWDWLAQEIASECLGEKEKIDIECFMDLLERNGVDHSRWTNRNTGWQGRFRMTGRVALQKVVANNGRLVKAMSESVPPANWVVKYKTKG
jgi:hypothetical protein